MKTFIIFLLLISSTVAFSSDDVDLTVFTDNVSTGTNKNRKFVVKANPTVIRIDDRRARVWFFSSFDKCTSFPCSTIELFEYHCVDRTQKLLSAYNYSESMTNGEVESIETTTPSEARIKYIIPGTVGETMMKYACNKRL